ncbi:PIG-L deacetylase family protein [Desulfatitalea tepidiphila]|uniref:PIG-L deacetylase family protein n=1 Tax=Desulfatitalea tepidiphila TaxID=1185843 RepID=UPI0006B4554B|nr:PIG-L deacetylase family protein [Desulfatitalea tepidiphila]
MKAPVDILVITAHPDDAEYGVAGTVALWIREGRSVAYVLCTSGEKGTSDRTLTPEKLAVIREQEQRAAAEILGVREVDFLRYPDQSIEDTPELRKHIVQIIRAYRPHTVVTTDPYRRYVWHRDHRNIGQVVLDAAFPFARDHGAYPDLLEMGYEPHKIKELWFFGTEDINHYSDIEETFDLKLAALKCHASQMRELELENLDEWMRARYRNLAKDSEYELAEAFHRVKLPG